MLTDRMLQRHIGEFERLRQQWIEMLVSNPNNAEAARRIVSINAKLELLRILSFPD